VVSSGREAQKTVTIVFNIVQIIVSILLIIVILLQVKGTGFSATFQSEAGIFRTRRGLERLLFNLTIGLAVVFAVVSLASVIAERLA